MKTDSILVCYGELKVIINGLKPIGYFLNRLVNITKFWLNDRSTIVKLLPQKLFLSPRRGSNPQPSDDRWDTLTIELPRLRWRAKVQIRHMCDPTGSHDMLINVIVEIHILEMWELGDWFLVIFINFLFPFSLFSLYSFRASLLFQSFHTFHSLPQLSSFACSS